MEENVIKGFLGIKGEQGLSAYEVAVANGYEGTEQDWLATLGTSSMFDQFKATTVTAEETSRLPMPSEYQEASFVDIYVDGLHLLNSEYEIVTENDNYFVDFVNPVESGKTIEIVVTMMTTYNMPISDTLDSESTNDTASGSKVVYDTITGLQATIPQMSEIVDLIYPVGSIYISANTTDPNTIFQGTTWQAIGQGRTLIGAGTGIDVSNVSKSFTNGNTGGWYNAVAVSHSHTMNSTGAHTHDIYTRVSTATGTAKSEPVSSSAGKERKATTSAGAHTHTINSTGVSGVNRNIQPYLVVNMWKRTE